MPEGKSMAECRDEWADWAIVVAVGSTVLSGGLTVRAILEEVFRVACNVLDDFETRPAMLLPTVPVGSRKFIGSPSQ